jgi:hypothetical protein
MEKKLVLSPTIKIVLNVLNKKCRKKGQLMLTLFFESNTVKGNFMAATLQLSQEVEGQVQPVDKKGKPAKVQEGSVEYSTSDENVAIVVEDPNDETKFVIKARGIGVAQISFKADANLGEGVKPIETFLAVEVFPDEAIGFGINLGEPRPQPEEETVSS